MNDRTKEKLVELLDIIIQPGQKTLGDIADYLIRNGVTVQKSSCPYCCDNGEGHGMLKHSYDDEDGMEMSIHQQGKKTDIKAKRGGRLYIFVENAEIFILKFARSAEGDLFR